VSVAASIVHVALAERSYDIHVTTGGLAETGAFAAAIVGTTARPSLPVAFVVTDRNVQSPHAEQVASSLSTAGFPTDTTVLEPGEHTKCLDCAATLYDRLVDGAADRRTLVVAVGGGVIGDLAGFVAATYLRGVPYLQVPTTLLAQVDSSVGGKVAVNHPKGKNLIGAFYQPRGVLIDTDVLGTLPDREYRCGLAEVVKYGVILDADFFAYLEEHVAEVNARDPAVLRHVVTRCCELKAEVVAADEREEIGRRAVLNYGHTFAHAFETTAGYSLLHGEAVAIGMICASRLAESLGMIAPSITARQERLLEALGLPTSPQIASGTGVSPVQDESSRDQVLAAMRHDKKAVAGCPRFILPTHIGHVEEVDGVETNTVEAILTGAP
jgi:3-dehydroquinate synthase